MRDDELVLSGWEEVYRALQHAENSLHNACPVQQKQLEKIGRIVNTQLRLLEDISIPARLICEHILESEAKLGQVAIEGENLRQPFSSVNDLQIEEFGMIHLTLASMEFYWRDGNYTYYLYPDKVELRAVDERSAVRMFFTQPFREQMVTRFPELTDHPKVMYLHPKIEKWCKKVL